MGNKTLSEMVDGSLILRSPLSEARCQVVQTNIDGHDSYILIYAVGYPTVRQWIQLQRDGSYYHWTYMKEKMPEATERERFDVTQAMESMGFNVSYEPEFLKKMTEWREAGL